MAEESGANQFSENVLQALKEFAESPEKKLNPTVHKATELIAATGLLCYPWDLVKLVLAAEMAVVLDEHNGATPVSTYTDDRERIINMLTGFAQAPFTIQRICELLLKPKFYSTTKKFVFAVDKLLSVTSTQQPLGPTDFNSQVASQTLAMIAVKQLNGELGGDDNNDVAPQSPASTSEATPPNTPFPATAALDAADGDVASSAPAPSEMQVEEPTGAASNTNNTMDVDTAAASNKDSTMDVDTTADAKPSNDDAMDVDKS